MGKLIELEQQNAALLRQLNARPIVFQFAPAPDDEDEDDEEAMKPEEHGEEEDAEQPVGLARVLTGKSAGGPGGGAEVAHAAPVASLLCGSSVWFKRRLKRVFSLLRKQRQAQNLERVLRTFTRSMLQSPVLLWLFYVHVLVLWFLEAWRQAVSQTLPTAPTERINQRMVETSGASASSVHATL